MPLGESGDVAPFETFGAEEAPVLEPGQRGYRAIVTVGQLDTDVSGLTPLNEEHQIAGASSDLTVVNVGPDANGLRLGDTIGFRLSYSAFVRSMGNPYTERRIMRDERGEEPAA